FDAKLFRRTTVIGRSLFRAGVAAATHRPGPDHLQPDALPRMGEERRAEGRRQLRFARENASASALLAGVAAGLGALPPGRLPRGPSPWRLTGSRVEPRASLRSCRGAGASSSRRVSAMRLRATSTSSTLTLTMSPALTTSRGSLT